MAELSLAEALASASGHRCNIGVPATVSASQRRRRPSPHWLAAVAIAVGIGHAWPPVATQAPPGMPAPLPPLVAPEPPLVPGRSPRNASYEIDARLDPASHTVTATAVIRWRNVGSRPTDELYLHLYWNAWRSSASTWMREAAWAGEDVDRPADDWSFIDLDGFALVAADGSVIADLLPAMAFTQPDDGNHDDRTLARVGLPAPVPPGGDIILRTSWQARVPRTFSRTGRIDRFYFLAHWFPKLAVYEDTRWTAHQFHANTEFFSDYGRYDVRLTVPSGWVVGATGVEQSRTDNGDGTATHRYAEDDVHDFAWTTSPDFVEHRRTFAAGDLPRVEMRLLLQPEHAGQEDRHFAATAAALQHYGEWYGAYTYPQITIVDPAWGSGAGGMEYPTLFTAGTRWLAPVQSNTPEAVTVHEAGHQFWYGLVGNNEFEHAWLDEGLNTFSEERVQSLAFQPNFRVDRFFGGFVPWQYREIPLSRATDGNGLNGYRLAAESDVPATPTYRYWPGTHASISYFKTALWLHTLERHLGWDTLQRILATFFERWRFRHPRPDDFFAVANEVSGQDLTWFFDQVHRSSNVFDYGVGEVLSVAAGARGYDEARPAPQFANRTDSSQFRTTVVVRRYGEAIFPVEVVTTFEDGEQRRERWDGVDRWRQYTYERPTRAARVEIDPERVLLLDVAYTNNSWTRQPQAVAAADKWSLTWMAWLQDLLLTWSFFV